MLNDLTKKWQAWRTELPELTNHLVPKCYYHFDKKKHYLQLYDFADASQVAYGGVVNMCTVYQDTTADVSLVMAKSRFATLDHINISPIEAKWRFGSRQTARCHQEGVTNSTESDVRTDSVIDIGWLNVPAAKFKTFVANWVENIRSKVPTSHWKHIPTRSNKADLVSRMFIPMTCS